MSVEGCDVFLFANTLHSKNAVLFNLFNFDQFKQL